MTAAFRKSPFGYRMSEVDEYVEKLKGEIESLKTETAALEKRLDEQEEQLKKYREQERFISGAILNAQNQAVEIEQRAQESYDRTMLRLTEDSKLWEGRIAKNKERLVALDGMIQEFLVSIKHEMTAALTPSMDAWQKAIDSGESPQAKPADAEASEKSAKDPEKKTTDDEPKSEEIHEEIKDAAVVATDNDDAAESDEPEAAETDEEAPDTDESSPYPADGAKPAIDGDIQRIYWRLKRISEGAEEPPVERQKKSKSEAPRPAPVTSSGAKRDGVYLPNESDQERLAALCKELGTL